MKNLSDFLNDPNKITKICSVIIALCLLGIALMVLPVRRNSLKNWQAYTAEAVYLENVSSVLVLMRNSDNSLTVREFTSIDDLEFKNDVVGEAHPWVSAQGLEGNLRESNLAIKIVVHTHNMGEIKSLSLGSKQARGGWYE